MKYENQMKDIDSNTTISVKPLLCNTPTTVQEIVSTLIERNIKAWCALPVSVRVLMIDKPEQFLLVPSGKPIKDGDCHVNIVFNGTIWRYSDYKSSWILDEILK